MNNLMIQPRAQKFPCFTTTYNVALLMVEICLAHFEFRQFDEGNGGLTEPDRL